MEFRLSLLGGFDLVAGDRPVTLKGRKDRQLLAYLAMRQGKRHPRETLYSLLWGDREDEQARASLRQSLAAIRDAFQPFDVDPVLADRESITLRGELISTDVAAIENACSSKIITQNILDMAGRKLLEALDPTALEYAEWLLAERQRVDELSVRLLEIAVSSPEHDAPAEQLANRLLSLDPLLEAVHRAKIRLLFRRGARAEALKAYAACSAVLRKELNVSPSAETEMLYQQLTASQQAPRTGLPAAGPETALPFASTANPATSAARGAPSLVVLPFTNLSGETEQQYLVDGMTEDLITDLAKVPGLFVIAPQTSFSFRSEPDAAMAGRELGVQFVVKGSIRRVSHNLRVNAQLIRALSGEVLWADRFDRDIEGIYSLQSELANRIAQKIRGPDYVVPPERYRPANLEAYELVMLGRNEWRHSDDAGTRAAHLFRRAIEIDPGYSEAYRWLAHGHHLSWLYYNSPIEPARAKALEYARRAVACDSGDAAAHAVLAAILSHNRDWDAANAEIDLALKLNPNDSETWATLSFFRIMDGQGGEAVYSAERAIECNPRPLGYFYWMLGQAQIVKGDLEAAVVTLRREETYRTVSRRQLAAALAMSGRLEEAQDEGRLFMAAYPHFTIRHWVEIAPFRDLTVRDRFVEAYRKAGLPDG